MRAFLDLMLWGTGGPLMYVALGLAVLAAAFYWTFREWAQNIHEVPLNYISEPKYRTPKPLEYYQTGIMPVMMATASSAYAFVEHRRHLERAVWR